MSEGTVTSKRLEASLGPATGLSTEALPHPGHQAQRSGQAAGPAAGLAFAEVGVQEEASRSGGLLSSPCRAQGPSGTPGSATRAPSPGLRGLEHQTPTFFPLQSKNQTACLACIFNPADM